MAAELNNNYEDGGTINNRQEIQAAIAKSVELRALHATLLMQPNTHTPSRPLSHFSAHDYPVFTPSYQNQPLPGYAHLQTASQTIPESCYDEAHIDFSDKNLQRNIQNHICPVDDTRSVASSCSNHRSFLQYSSGTEILQSRRRNSLGDFKSISSCNNCKPATVSIDNDNRSIKLSNNIVVPLTDSNVAINPSQAKNRGIILSWLLPRFKRRQKNGNISPVRTESEEVSQVLKDLGTLPIETLKIELTEANRKRDEALNEVSEMRSSFGELRKKLDTLESYCEELKKALRQAVQTNNISQRGNFSSGKNGHDSMPVSEEVRIEGFLQIVSETRLSVKQFCKTLLEQIDENDEQLMENLNLVLKPYKLSLSSRHSKMLLYHLEALVNQAFFEDFENCVFQKNGTPKLLDPQEHRQAQFQSYVSLRNLSWNEVQKKGTKYHSEKFNEFCDQKMRCIINTLNWTKPWSETLLQLFFVAGKCIWLLHLLAFSFYPPLTILRVDENRRFDPHYMEDLFIDKQKVENTSRVKVMIMPGFYVQDKILRCKVLCRYKSTV